MMHLTEDQEKQIFEMGRLGFSCRDIAINFNLPIREVVSQFVTEDGNVFFAWKKGNIQAMYDLRKTIMESALNSSTPAIKEMLLILSRVEKLNEDADEYL